MTSDQRQPSRKVIPADLPKYFCLTTYLSSFNVIGVLRGVVARRPGTVGMRKGLVVFQFVMSMLLIIGTMTVYTQIDYIRSKNLGMDRENLVVLNLEGDIAVNALFLNKFTYRIEISWQIFLMAGVAALVIAWLTVSYQSIKAALANPVTALRTE